MNGMIFILARSRGELSAGHVLLCLGVGVFVAVVLSFFMAREFRKRDGQMTPKRWSQVAMYALSGVIIGYFMMRITIRSNPETFDPAPKVKIPELKPYVVPKPKLILPNTLNQTSRPAPTAEQIELERQREAQVQAARQERERQAAEARAERERQIEEARIQRKRELQIAREQREIEARDRRAALEAAQAAEEAARLADQKYLSSLTIEQLQAEGEKRREAIDAAKQAMREPGGTTEERAAISKEFSRAIRAYQDAIKAMSEKRRAAAGH